MKSIRIDYYTGTGGCQFIVEELTKKFVLKGINVEINRIKRANIHDLKEIIADYYILIFPVHSFNAPKPIYEWVKHLQGNKTKTSVISISGGGDIITNSACRVKTVSLLKKNHFNIIFEEMIRMPNNWMKVPKKEKYTKILSKLPFKINDISEAILSQTKQKKIIYWIDYLISALGEMEKKTTPKFGNGIRVLESCNGCGLCAENCCSSNIVMENQKPNFKNECDMCLGCIYNCPQKALLPTYAGFQVDKKGYDLKKMIYKPLF